jgi:NAD(P)-dependent dehydrogenase (short-subunit alcohol dehydrogenase family)
MWAVVNNAAVIGLHGIDWGQEGVEDYRYMLDTNVLGSIRVTKAFLPLLRKTKKSRLLMVGSVAGRIEFPGMAAYSMSKFALRSFANALRREVKPWDVYVTIVEPVLFGTPLTEKAKLLQGLDKTWNKTPETISSDYSKENRDNLRRSVEAWLELSHPDNSKVIETMTSIVASSHEPNHVHRVSSFPELIMQYMYEIFPSDLTDDYMFGPLFVIMSKGLLYSIILGEYLTKMGKTLIKPKSG